ncbi:MAG: geranylgeranyl reductase family protein [Thermoanaerobacteraceae bacterium]|nr:geranylgeranyl reductase family protein [Thermoanaerobacteraceae bacterium]
MKYDVAIIGAGPAGAYCAKTLAEKGLKVLILDKAKFPRNKICGGLISSKTLKLIQDDCSNEYLTKLGPKPVYKIILTCGQKEVALEKNEVLGIIVRRKQFDEAIANMAVDKGAHFVDNCEYRFHMDLKSSYEIYTTKGIFFSDYLIGADGVYSKVAKISKLRQRFSKWEMGLAVSCEIPRELIIEKNGAEFVFLKILAGMGWCFSGKDFVNLGVGGYAPDSKKILQAAKKLVLNRLKNKNFPFKLRASFLPAGGRKRQIANERIFLVGDAAGFVDAFSGEGIYYALNSGKIAAETIANNQTGKMYEKKCYSIFLNEFRFSAIMSVVLGDRDKIYQKGVDRSFSEAFYNILTTPPESGCYSSFIYSIIKHGISPTFPYLWIQSLFFA